MARVGAAPKDYKRNIVEVNEVAFLPPANLAQLHQDQPARPWAIHPLFALLARLHRPRLMVSDASRPWLAGSRGSQAPVAR